MTSFALLFFSVIPLIALGILLNGTLRDGSTLRTVVIGATLFHELVLVAFPIWYSVFTNFYLESQEISASPDKLLKVMIGEAIFVALFALSMSFGKKSPPRDWRTLLLSESNRTEMLFVVLLALIGLLINIQGFMAPVADIQELIHHADIKIGEIWWEILLRWIRVAYTFPCLVAAAMLFVESKVSRLWRLVGATSLAALALAGLSTGNRGRLTWVISLLVIVGYLLNRKKVIYGAVGVLVLALPLFSFLGGSYRWTALTELRGGSRQEALSRMFDSVKTGGVNDPGNVSFVAANAERAQGPRNSVVLYDLYDGDQGAGFKPLFSAFFVPIPRVLWLTKRPLGSTDETSFGAAIYLVQRLGHAAPIFVMGPILASAHAYWEWGWIGVVLCGIITGLFWKVLFNLCERSVRPINLIVVLIFAAALLIDGFLTALEPLYAIVGIFWTGVLPVLLLYLAVLLANRVIQGNRALSAQRSRTKKVVLARSHRKTA